MNYQLRREKLRASLDQAEIGQVLIQNLDNIYYFSGFNALVTSRPMGLVISREKACLIVPIVAADSARKEAGDMDIAVYYEHPVGEQAEIGFYASLAKTLATGTQGGNIGVEAGKFSLDNLKILNELGLQPQDISRHLQQLRAIKEPEELDAIRTAARYVDYCVEKSVAEIRQGISEVEIDRAGVCALNKQTAADLPGASVACFSMSLSGAARSVMLHASSGGRKIRPGDAVVLCRQVAINGYWAQCDRTVFLGKPTPEQLKYFSLVQAAHAAAVEIIRQGIIASQIDQVIRAVYEKAGVAKYFLHRSGSGFGIGTTEIPHLSFDSKDLINGNMALVIQPALYIPGVGGFRYSDTVFVKDGGNEIISRFPKDINTMAVTSNTPD
ncbi:Xaa-Pro dipeptidase [Desulfotomaculum arcticum]|uniref:Xaa-Pro dipeptidase n=1 Tax=Desulfotruncus arcticus DSM 17038 TaxID=1121424 RepID=A0A1I2USH6_9FIRM|nr:Xaa-Pro peptidase family protein [Desulfotruncus arcticus]SFG78757.1 Xaa-Pro dipeptidase [Desulfotomaculum arcticum] [Desulfotruncus arcticus DSM 17038]